MKITSLISGVSIIALVLFSSFNILPTDKNSKSIREVKFGKQTWMLDNLNVENFRNGDPIPHAITNEEWQKAGEEGKPAWCYYDNNPANETKYGKLYNWFAVNDPRGLAPNGWHIPSVEEWIEITDYLGGMKTARIKMTATDNKQIVFMNHLGGGRIYNGSFSKIDERGIYWSSTPEGAHSPWAWAFAIYLNRNEVKFESPLLEGGFSVRCVKD